MRGSRHRLDTGKVMPTVLAVGDRVARREPHDAELVDQRRDTHARRTAVALRLGTRLACQSDGIARSRKPAFPPE